MTLRVEFQFILLSRLFRLPELWNVYRGCYALLPMWAHVQNAYLYYIKLIPLLTLIATQFNISSNYKRWELINYYKGGHYASKHCIRLPYIRHHGPFLLKWYADQTFTTSKFNKIASHGLLKQWSKLWVYTWIRRVNVLPSTEVNMWCYYNSCCTTILKST